MPGVRLIENRLRAGRRFSMRLERTLRVPNDGRRYPLPPTLGALPIYRTREFASARPSAGRGEFLVPLYPWEALWLSFEAEEWKPNAVQVASGGINVITGEPFPAALSDKPQNYLVCPQQPWLDGIRTEQGSVRQFVAVPPESGLTLEEQLTGASARGGLQVRVFEPLPGVFPERRPRGWSRSAYFAESLMPAEMGLAGGGAIEQKIYPDPHGLHIWDAQRVYDIGILILSSLEFRTITGHAPPPSPISVTDYDRMGLPWFNLYDDELGDLGAAENLKRLQTSDRGDVSGAPKTIRAIVPKADIQRRRRK